MTVRPPHRRSTLGYAAALGGSLEGAAFGALLFGGLGVSLRGLFSTAVFVGVGAGVWLGALVGCWRALRRRGHASRATTALLGTILAAAVGLARLVQALTTLDFNLEVAPGAAPIEELSVAFVGLALSLPVVALGALAARAASTSFIKWFRSRSDRSRLVIAVAAAASLLPVAATLQFAYDNWHPDRLFPLSEAQFRASDGVRSLLTAHVESLANFAIASSRTEGLSSAVGARDHDEATRILRSVAPVNDGVIYGTGLSLDLLAVTDAHGIGISELHAPENARELPAVGRSTPATLGTNLRTPELDAVLRGDTAVTIVGVDHDGSKMMLAVSPVGDGGALVAGIGLSRLETMASSAGYASVGFYTQQRNRIAGVGDQMLPEHLSTPPDGPFAPFMHEHDGTVVSTAVVPLYIPPLPSAHGPRGPLASDRTWWSLPDAKRVLFAASIDATPYLPSTEAGLFKIGGALALAIGAIVASAVLGAKGGSGGAARRRRPRKGPQFPAKEEVPASV